KLETVGQAIPGVDVEIAADGEVLTRGPHVMKGYWNNLKASAETIRDGWLYTGDLGSLDAEGFLSITGRKKELLVLSNGKKVVPNYLEGLILADDCIDQVVIYGEARNFLTALVVPHWNNLRQTAAAEGLTLNHESEDALAKSPAVEEFLRRRIGAALKDESAWEQVKKLLILPRPFTVADEELTVSLKLRREVIFNKHNGRLQQLYQEGDRD